MPKRVSNLIYNVYGPEDLKDPRNHSDHLYNFYQRTNKEVNWVFITNYRPRDLILNAPKFMT